jgi:hypothetical protein
MKTRQEMIYDFMLALAPCAYSWQEELLEMNGEVTPTDVIDLMYEYAYTMTDRYLESLQ